MLALSDKIVLVGMMGAGKSTVGRRLAERIGYAFVDLDAEIERQAGQPISRLFSEQGELAFRQLEAETAKSQDSATRTVLAVGGGWMARPELRDRWPDSVRVWLRVSPNEAWRRISGDLPSRPMLDPLRARETLEQLMAERELSYGQAEISVESTATSPEETAELVLELLRMHARNGRSARGAAGS